MFTPSERLICSILGITRSDIRPIACSLDVIVELLFRQHIPKGKIRVTYDVYPMVAHLLNKSVSSVSRSTERIANLCWDIACRENRHDELFGRKIHDIPSSSDILFYLAVLLHYGKPLFTVFEDLDRIHESA